MHERLALRLLRRIMKWNEEIATREYAWVRLLARFKYDGYGDYVAGVHFAESLAGWLSQFEQSDRQAAYDFIKNHLIYFSASEIQRLVEQLYPRFVEPRLRNAAATELGLPRYLVWSETKANEMFERKRRQTLFIGLSDGARFDILRRSNSGILMNDQIVLATHIDEEKWEDLGTKLCEDIKVKREDSPKFEYVYLVDDFVGSGTTFLRKKRDGNWTGKVKRFWDALGSARHHLETRGKSLPLSTNFELHVHHYISTTQARETIVSRLRDISKELGDNWFQAVHVTEGLLLPDNIRLTHESGPPMWDITEKYYDHDIYEQLKEHLPAEQLHLKRGYSNCALPVVLEHNCPNNAITLLWAETDGKNGLTMRPLFRRRHRHS
jgi:hypothetical protein